MRSYQASGAKVLLESSGEGTYRGGLHPAQQLRVLGQRGREVPQLSSQPRHRRHGGLGLGAGGAWLLLLLLQLLLTVLTLLVVVDAHLRGFLNISRLGDG